MVGCSAAFLASAFAPRTSAFPVGCSTCTSSRRTVSRTVSVRSVTSLRRTTSSSRCTLFQASTTSKVSFIYKRFLRQDVLALVCGRRLANARRLPFPRGGTPASPQGSLTTTRRRRTVLPCTVRAPTFSISSPTDITSTALVDCCEAVSVDRFSAGHRTRSKPAVRPSASRQHVKKGMPVRTSVSHVVPAFKFHKSVAYDMMNP